VTVGPSEVFALFFKNNSGPVFRALLAGTLNRAAAEDATAEAFARALAHWETVAVHPNPRGVGAAGRNLSTFLRRQAELFTESPPVSTRAG
jgi:predicted RNA polymerase sigma factor